jgi:YesN/AraC family two-component response regulator
MSHAIRILIADDHTMVRQGLSQICGGESDMTVVGQASNGQEACRLADLVEPHVVVMDINMPLLMGCRPRATSPRPNRRLGLSS